MAHGRIAFSGGTFILGSYPQGEGKKPKVQLEIGNLCLKIYLYRLLWGCRENVTMIEKINWNPRSIEQGERPFAGLGALKITFHNSSFNQLSEEDAQALDVLRELCYSSQLEVYQIGSYDKENWPETTNTIKIHYDSYHHRLWTDVTNSYPLQRFDQILSFYDSNGIKNGDILSDLEVVSLQAQQRNHILVTGSKFILNNRRTELVHKSNPRSPVEAVKIVSLLLRTQGNYVVFMHPNRVISVSRELFYWILTRRRLPQMWRYVDACFQAGRIRRDDTAEVANSILVRTMRTFEALDAIGMQFYQPQSSDAQDYMSYHFEYLLLLLGGIFDGMARIAHRAYNLKCQENHSGFYKENAFRKELSKHPNANSLYKAISGQKFSDLMKLIYELRNTIHGAGLVQAHINFGDIFSTHDDLTYLEVPVTYQNVIWNSANQTWRAGEWGLTKEYFDTMFLEPYTYSKKLIEESLKKLNEIALTTNVMGLFPNKENVPTFRDEPPSNPNTRYLFGDTIGKRLDLLV